jgi:hypothetical protein
MLHRVEWYAFTWVWQDRNDFIFSVMLSNNRSNSSKFSIGFMHQNYPYEI